VRYACLPFESLLTLCPFCTIAILTEPLVAGTAVAARDLFISKKYDISIGGTADRNISFEGGPTIPLRGYRVPMA
jgi:hypothetical protein